MNTWPDPYAEQPRLAMRPGGGFIDLDEQDADAAKVRSEQQSIDARNAARQAEREQELAAAISPGVAVLMKRVEELERRVHELEQR